MYSNPFAEWPLRSVEENLLNQVQEVRDHPMFGQDLGADAEVMPPAQLRQCLELLLREEAIRFMQDRIRSSRLPLPVKIALPKRVVTRADWQQSIDIWPRRLEQWTTGHYSYVREGMDATDNKRREPMPDCVEIMLQDHLE